MFPKLDAYKPSDKLIDQLAASMREGVNGADGVDPNHPTLPAGYTYFGQFLDHDLTFDPLSNLRRENDLTNLADFRTPRLDLDSVYGSGPLDMPFLYDQREQPRGTRLLTGDSQASFGAGFAVVDLPRNSDGRALIGDPRNDENAILAQLHLIFLQFHNRLVAELLGGLYANRWSPRKEDVFSSARRLVSWHYQWLVVNDFLPRVVPKGLVDWLLGAPGKPDRKRRRFEPTPRYFHLGQDLFMPVEFSGAAYRFGHTLVRPRYRLNDEAAGVQLFATSPDPLDPNHLGGFRPLLADLVVDWGRFVELDGRQPQRARRLDTRLAEPLASLPAGVAPAGEAGRSLAWLNLSRGRALKLPSGQDVAKAMDMPVLDDEALRLTGARAPLWYYILAEAETLGGGVRLGPTGGRIVAEVLLALLDADEQSYFRQADAAWTPFLGTQPGRFTLADLVGYATRRY